MLFPGDPRSGDLQKRRSEHCSCLVQEIWFPRPIFPCRSPSYDKISPRTLAQEFPNSPLVFDFYLPCDAWPERPSFCCNVTSLQHTWAAPAGSTGQNLKWRCIRQAHEQGWELTRAVAGRVVKRVMAMGETRRSGRSRKRGGCRCCRCCMQTRRGTAAGGPRRRSLGVPAIQHIQLSIFAQMHASTSKV